MHKITLVCSVHGENGLCNIGELLKILDALDPNVIFEEIRPQDFDSYYKHGTRWILETRAVAQYIKNKPVKQIPVDNYTLPENLFEIVQKIGAIVEQGNIEYQSLQGERDRNVSQYGFCYLNSIACEETNAKIIKIEEETIVATGDQVLISGLEMWAEFMLRRECQMINNIYDYCRDNTFNKGIFLVGAGHRASIRKEIERRIKEEEELIEWNFYSRPGINIV